MTDKKSLLDIRNDLKSKKPVFTRQDAHKKKRLGEKWRKPRGIQSKMRLHLKGYRASTSKGYRSPVDVRGLSRSGLREVLVSSLSDLAGVDKVKDICVLSSTLGQKKKYTLVKEIVKLGLQVSNVKDCQKFLTLVEEDLKKRKSLKTKKKDVKDKKQKEASAKADKKDKEEKKSIDDLANADSDKAKDAVKKEQDKILTKKGQN